MNLVEQDVLSFVSWDNTIYSIFWKCCVLQETLTLIWFTTRILSKITFEGTAYASIMPQIIVLPGSHSSHTTDFWEVFRWLEMPCRLLMDCYKDFYWKWIFMKRHKHSSWIFFNSVQQLDSGRTRQAWQMSLQPMVQLYKRNVSGESGDQNNLHFGDHCSIKSSFCGYPTKPCESCNYFGGGGWPFPPAKPPIIEALFLMIGAVEAKCLLLSLSGGSARAIRARRWDQWDLLAPTL